MSIQSFMKAYPHLNWILVISSPVDAIVGPLTHHASVAESADAHAGRSPDHHADCALAVSHGIAAGPGRGCPLRAAIEFPAAHDAAEWG